MQGRLRWDAGILWGSGSVLKYSVFHNNSEVRQQSMWFWRVDGIYTLQVRGKRTKTLVTNGIVIPEGGWYHVVMRGFKHVQRMETLWKTVKFHKVEMSK